MLKLALLVSCGCVLIEASVVSPVSAVPAPTELIGRWLAEDIGGGGVIDDLQTTLEINDDGTYAGFAGCNSFTGIFDVKTGTIAFGPAGTTRKTCAPAVMNQEARFLDILKAQLAYQIDETKLVLTGSGPTASLRLAPL